MDKAVVVGVYEFIGFHLCLSLLEKGIEVEGVHLPSGEDDPFLEEKRLSIGRNSNFNEAEDWSFPSFREEKEITTYFIDYYSFYMKKKENTLLPILNELMQVDQKQQIVITMPIQMCSEREETNNSLVLDVMNVTRVFYLPTIYGPWQPLHFLFQQAILNPPNKISINDREYTEDALYIGDVIPVILKQIERDNRRAYLLKSNINDHWKKGTELLLGKAPSEFTRFILSNRQDVVSLSVDGLAIKEGINNQRNHLAKIGII